MERSNFIYDTSRWKLNLHENYERRAKVFFVLIFPRFYLMPPRLVNANEWTLEFMNIVINLLNIVALITAVQQRNSNI